MKLFGLGIYYQSPLGVMVVRHMVKEGIQYNMHVLYMGGGKYW